MHEVMVVAGTRPEIIKMAPILRALRNNSVPQVFVNCGQHYDYEMSQQFIEELELPAPDCSFRINASSAGEQTAKILLHMDEILKKTQPRIVLVEGDTNSVLAAALGANKRNIPVGHVEAGLRSFDLRMPEEHNRRLTDHLSTFLFAPTATSEANLKKENVWGKIYLTGNTVIDSVLQHFPMAEKKSRILEKIRFAKFALATAHRAENVDDLKLLINLMEVLAESPVPVVFPIHPRTKKRLRQNGVYAKLKRNKNVQILPPLGYFDFLILMKQSELILTDSGGIQEEATAPIIRKPVLVMRLSTERPEAVESGFAQVVGTDKKEALKALDSALTSQKALPNLSPFGDGTAAEKIVTIVREELFPD